MPYELEIPLGRVLAGLIGKLFERTGLCLRHAPAWSRLLTSCALSAVGERFPGRRMCGPFHRPERDV